MRTASCRGAVDESGRHEEQGRHAKRVEQPVPWAVAEVQAPPDVGVWCTLPAIAGGNPC